MCSFLAYPLIGVLAAALLMAGIGMAFQGLGTFSMGLAVLGQTIMQPVFLIVGSLLGGLAGFSTALALPRYIEVYRAIQDARRNRPPESLTAEQADRLLLIEPQATPCALPEPARRVLRRRSLAPQPVRRIHIDL